MRHGRGGKNKRIFGLKPAVFRGVCSYFVRDSVRRASPMRTTARSYRETRSSECELREADMADKAHQGIEVDGERLRAAVDRLVGSDRPRYRRLWTYFKNPMRVCGAGAAGGDAGSERPYRQGQEWGLTSRITG